MSDPIRGEPPATSDGPEDAPGASPGVLPSDVGQDPGDERGETAAVHASEASADSTDGERATARGLSDEAGQEPAAARSRDGHAALADAVDRLLPAGAAPVRWLWAVTLAAVVGDLATTVYGLHIGLVERNPVVAAALARFGVVGMVALKGIAVSWVLAIRRVFGRTYGVAALFGLALPQSVAVVLNLLTILSV